MASGSRNPRRPSRALTYLALGLLSGFLGSKGAQEKGLSCRISIWSSGHSEQRSATCAQDVHEKWREREHRAAGVQEAGQRGYGQPKVRRRQDGNVLMLCAQAAAGALSFQQQRMQ